MCNATDRIRERSFYRVGLLRQEGGGSSSGAEPSLSFSVSCCCVIRTVNEPVLGKDVWGSQCTGA